MEKDAPGARDYRHRLRVGGPGVWKEIGLLQFEFLVDQGLRPEHYMLDIGCGSLRGGQHFIPYLEPGHYFGVERQADLMEAGLQLEIDPEVARLKRPVLVPMDDFAFERLDQTFDFALAQSVFTHLSLNAIMRCLVNVARVLRADGRFYASFFENRGGKRNLEPLVQSPGDITTFFDTDPFHYDFDTIACASSETGLEVEYLGEWNHPRAQRMMLFTRSQPTLKEGSE
jgi:SAM-dependent methyltransferase